MIIKSLENLKIISSQIAKKVTKEDCILLFGKIGTGKTTFTRYFINFLQKNNNIEITEVLSPTFNLVYEYELKMSKIMHYDLFRLKNIQDIKQLDIFNHSIKTIKIIEWPELIKAHIKDKLEISFKYTKKENERDIILKGYGKWKNFKVNVL